MYAVLYKECLVALVICSCFKFVPCWHIQKCLCFVYWSSSGVDCNLSKHRVSGK